jgi:hypothetical protein
MDWFIFYFFSWHSEFYIAMAMDHQVSKQPRFGAGNRAMGMMTEPYKLTRRCEVTAILILYGLPRYIFRSLFYYSFIWGTRVIPKNQQIIGNKNECSLFVCKYPQFITMRCSEEQENNASSFLWYAAWIYSWRCFLCVSSVL